MVVPLLRDGHESCAAPACANVSRISRFDQVPSSYDEVAIYAHMGSPFFGALRHNRQVRSSVHSLVARIVVVRSFHEGRARRIACILALRVRSKSLKALISCSYNGNGPRRPIWHSSCRPW
jgi:hypothetical protein